MSSYLIIKASDPHLFFLDEAEHLDSMSFIPLPVLLSKSATDFNPRDCAAESVTVTLSLEGGIEFLLLVLPFVFFCDMARRKTSLQRAVSANHFHKTVGVDGMLLSSLSLSLRKLS